MTRPASLLPLLLFAAPAAGQITVRVDVDSSEVQASSGGSLPSISADGRCVAFHSPSTDLVAGDTNGVFDVFVREQALGTTVRVSVDSAGVQGDANSSFPAISGDGRFVAFQSAATNLVAGDTNGVLDVFVRDRLNATTQRVSVHTTGTPANADCNYAAISADGRIVAFLSASTTLVTGDTNLAADVFVHDRQTGITTRASVDSGGLEANGPSFAFAPPSVSADGRWIGFYSFASNLVAGDANATGDAFLRDRQLGTTERVSLGTGGVEGNNVSFGPSISADARFAAFHSNATNLVAGDTNGWTDVFVRDRVLGTTERVSLATGGGQGNQSSLEAAISADGRLVAFYSEATNLVAGDTNAVSDVFFHDRQTAVTERASVATGGAQANAESGFARISGDGRFVAFGSNATNLVAGDTNGVFDVFVRDRVPSGFTSLCDPGASGVIACPCGNPPSGAGRGCDNSSATGGASLAASGLAYLATDSLVFTTSGEKPTATSILLQGNAAAGSGIVYGQGVRCVAGSLKRLFTKSAVGGSITAPDFGAGDPTVSARSAAKGDPISPGQTRWYLVYYRDPIVLGGCPATSTFNATQSGRVSWWP